MITPHFIRNVIIKGLLLFLAVNMLWAVFDPSLGKLSSYNSFLRGRERFPFGEDSARSYNLSLYNLDAMFASLKLNGNPKQENEFRVFVIGDSSVWGTLLRPEETLAGQLDAAQLLTSEGKTIRIYNLGYPTLSLTKDLMILDQAMLYQPDLILWSVTLESFPRDRQLQSPVVANNLQRVASLIQRFDLNLNLPEDKTSFWDKTLIGQRRELADLLRLQLYGVMWSATGIDQTYPTDYEPAAIDLEADKTFNGWNGPEFPPDVLAFDILSAGIKRAGDVPVVLINEPILVSTGENSDVRYNFYYPRWAYDAYRQQLSTACVSNDWECLDLWDIVPQEHFTNSAIHLDPRGEGTLVEMILGNEILNLNKQ